MTDIKHVSKRQLVIMFISANLVSLGAGTPYLYSFYAPQLLKKCHLAIERSSDFSFAMSIGMSAMGVLAGMIIDTSPQLASGIGALLTFLAYSTLNYCYTRAYGSVILISCALLMVGFGSICSFYAAMKCCTTNFPNHRGAAGAFPISQYALSGLLFSFLCSHLFGEDMGAVFTFLTVICTSTAVLGSLTLKVFDEPKKSQLQSRSTDKTAALEQNETNLDTSDVNIHTQPILIERGKVKRNSSSSFNYNTFKGSSTTSLTPGTDNSSFNSSVTSIKRSDSTLWAKELVGSLQFWGIGRARPSDSNINGTNAWDNRKNTFSVNVSPGQRRDSLVDRNSRSSLHQAAETDLSNDNIVTALTEENDVGEEQHLTLSRKPESGTVKINSILSTFTKPRFFAYLFTLASLQGIGQMYIFAVGFVVSTQVQSSQEPLKFNQEELQSLQVSLISVMSFCGRLLSGPTSDLLVKKFHAQRLWLIICSAVLCIIASKNLVSSKAVFDTGMAVFNRISISSAIFGFAFGMAFGTFPAIIADSFGTAGFSTIWGLSTAGGIFSVKLLSKVLAYDLASNMEEDQVVCTKGVTCYSHTFHVTQLWGVFAIGLASLTMLVGYRNRLKRHHATFILED